MLIESDMFIAYMKRSDLLKEPAARLFRAVEEGRLEAQASTEVLHEAYYVFSDHASLPTILGNLAKIASLDHIEYIDATREIHLSALDIMNKHGVTSVFDAIYAATVLSHRVPDHTIASTDTIYDKVPGITRTDPRNLHI